MPVMEPEARPRKKVLFTGRVDPSVVEMLRAYCEFLNSSRQHHVVERLLRYAFSRDKEFQAWLEPAKGKSVREPRPRRAAHFPGTSRPRQRHRRRRLLELGSSPRSVSGDQRHARARRRERPARPRRHPRRVQRAVVHQPVPSQLVRAVVRLHLPLASARRHRAHRTAALPGTGPAFCAVPRLG